MRIPFDCLKFCFVLRISQMQEHEHEHMHGTFSFARIQRIEVFIRVDKSLNVHVHFCKLALHHIFASLNISKALKIGEDVQEEHFLTFVGRSLEHWHDCTTFFLYFSLIAVAFCVCCGTANKIQPSYSAKILNFDLFKIWRQPEKLFVLHVLGNVLFHKIACCKFLTADISMHGDGFLEKKMSNFTQKDEVLLLNGIWKLHATENKSGTKQTFTSQTRVNVSCKMDWHLCVCLSLTKLGTPPVVLRKTLSLKLFCSGEGCLQPVRQEGWGSAQGWRHRHGDEETRPQHQARLAGEDGGDDWHRR